MWAALTSLVKMGSEMRMPSPLDLEYLDVERIADESLDVKKIAVKLSA